MSMAYPCEKCGEKKGDLEALAVHLMNVHGVNRTKAHEQAGLVVPVAMADRQQAVVDKTRTRTELTAQMARGHAQVLDVLALGFVVGGLLGLLAAALAGIEFLAVGLSVLFWGVLSWGLLRAVALVLRLGADRNLLAAQSVAEPVGPS